MGDMFGDWVPDIWIQKVLNLLSSKFNLKCKFLFLTKNPKRYSQYQKFFKENMMLGSTIETNRHYKISKAPSTFERYMEMKNLTWKHKTIVIEPILDFDFEFITWLKNIRPEAVDTG